MPAFDTGLACPGFAVLESDSGTKEFSGYYDGAGNATEWVIHFNQNSSDPGNRLINAMTGRSVPFDEHFTATLTQFDAASGTFGILTQTGLALRVSAPGQGLILLDVGKLVLDLNTGAVIELHGRYDTFSGHTQKLCAALT